MDKACLCCTQSSGTNTNAAHQQVLYVFVSLDEITKYNCLYMFSGDPEYIVLFLKVL